MNKLIYRTLKKDRDYWKARCVSAEESTRADHFAKVASGFFSTDSAKPAEGVE